MKAVVDDSYSSPVLDQHNPLSRRICVAGCPVDRVSYTEVLRELCTRIERKQRTHVVFINAAKVVRYRQDNKLREAIDRANLLLADGVPIVWASRLKGNPLPGRVNGTDLMHGLLRESSERGYRVFLFGSRPEVLRRCAEEVSRLYPKIKVVGCRSGYFSSEQEENIVQQINKSRPDIVFVGMSTPQKELWGDRNLSTLNVAVCQGVGGSFDVLAGLVRRAPRWMQHCGLEWLFRLLQEPTRLWRRYLETNSAFVWFVLNDLVKSRKSKDMQNEN